MRRPDPRLVVLGAAVRKIRRELELSQEAVERRGGLPRNQVGAVERGEKDVQLSTLLRISDGLGVPVSEIASAYEGRLRVS